MTFAFAYDGGNCADWSSLIIKKREPLKTFIYPFIYPL